MIGSIDIAAVARHIAIVGPLAVARLTQGISPKHCNSPARRAEDMAICLISTSLSSGGGNVIRAFDSRPVSCRVQPSVVSLPKEMRNVLL